MKKHLSVFALLLLFPSLIFAHDGHDSGFLSGITHPILGLDHLLAMLCVGILSAQLGGKSVWTIPAIFVGVMLFGGIMGMGAEGITFIETAIALSVIILGAAIVLKEKFPLIIIMTLVAFFGFNHGFAHGVEMPKLANATQYAIGFLLGTILIHLAGVAIGHIGSSSKRNARFLQYLGAFIAGMGLQILIG